MGCGASTSKHSAPKGVVSEVNSARGDEAKQEENKSASAAPVQAEVGSVAADAPEAISSSVLAIGIAKRGSLPGELEFKAGDAVNVKVVPTRETGLGVGHLASDPDKKEGDLFIGALRILSEEEKREWIGKKGDAWSAMDNLVWLKGKVSAAKSGAKDLVENLEILGAKPAESAKTVGGWFANLAPSFARDALRAIGHAPAVGAVFSILGGALEMVLSHREAREKTNELVELLEKAVAELRDVVDGPMGPIGENPNLEDAFLALADAVWEAYELVKTWAGRWTLTRFVFSSERISQLSDAATAISATLNGFTRERVKRLEKSTALVITQVGTHSSAIAEFGQRIEALEVTTTRTSILSSLSSVRNEPPVDFVRLNSLVQRPAITAQALEWIASSTNKILVVSGSAGMGKSVLASMVLRDVEDKVSVLWTLNGRDLQALASSLEALVRAIMAVDSSLNISSAENKIGTLDPDTGLINENLLRRMVEYLGLIGKNDKQPLVLIDGADELAAEVGAVSTRLSCGGSVKVIVTAWSAKGFPEDAGLDIITVDTLTREESLELLGKLHPEGKGSKGHEDLATAFGDYALALAQAGALLKRMRASSGDVGMLIEDICREVLEKGKGGAATALGADTPPFLSHLSGRSPSPRR